MANMFAELRKDIEKYDLKREEVIRESRLVLKAAKLLIYSVHRGQDMAKLYASLQDARSRLDGIVKKDNSLLGEGSYNDAMQEYVEAIAYFHFSTGKPLPSPRSLCVSGDNYLMGLCDLTGELSRKAVLSAIDKDSDTVKKIHSMVDNIMFQFLQFNLRNGQLRKKSDQIKWNLKRIEEVMYDMKKNG